MRKILALVALVFLFASFGYAQKSEIIYTDTTSNSEQEDITIILPDGCDSIAIACLYTGEIDMDRLIITKGLMNDGGAGYVAVSTADTTTLTVNNAASTTTGQVFDNTSEANGLSDLRGYDAVFLRFEAAAAGNDATDPNELLVKVTYYY